MRRNVHDLMEFWPIGHASLVFSLWQAIDENWFRSSRCQQRTDPHRIIHSSRLLVIYLRPLLSFVIDRSYRTSAYERANAWKHSLDSISSNKLGRSEMEKNGIRFIKQETDVTVQRWRGIRSRRARFQTFDVTKSVHPDIDADSPRTSLNETISSIMNPMISSRCPTSTRMF